MLYTLPYELGPCNINTAWATCKGQSWPRKVINFYFYYIRIYARLEKGFPSY